MLGYLRAHEDKRSRVRDLGIVEHLKRFFGDRDVARLRAKDVRGISKRDAHLADVVRLP